QILTKIVRSGGTKRTATPRQAGSRAQLLVGTTTGAHEPKCGGRGLGQQIGSHRLGGVVQERKLSRSRACSHHLKSLLRNDFPVRSAGEKKDGNGSLPRSRNLIPVKAVSRPPSL